MPATDPRPRPDRADRCPRSLHDAGAKGSQRSTGERAIACFAAASLAAMLLLLAEDCVVGQAGATDTIALLALRRTVDHPGPAWHALRELMLLATAMGAFPTLAMVVLAVAAILAANSRVSLAIRLTMAAAVGVGMANLLKWPVARPRPEVVTHWAQVTSMSFPSGHAADGATVYLLLACLAARSARRPAAGRVVVSGALALVILIGMSRLYLGVHWPSDIFGGWALGAAWAFVAAAWCRAQPNPSPRARRPADRRTGDGDEARR